VPASVELFNVRGVLALKQNKGINRGINKGIEHVM